jgi:hypothetical protein
MVFPEYLKHIRIHGYLNLVVFIYMNNNTGNQGCILCRIVKLKPPHL